MVVGVFSLTGPVRAGRIRIWWNRSYRTYSHPEGGFWKMAGDDSLMDPEIERLTEKLSKDPNSLVFAPLADAYRKIDLIEEAIDILKKGLEKHPNYASAYIVLGRCYQDQKMFELARSEFDKALEVDPGNFLAAKLYAGVLVSLGQKDEAIKRFRHLLEIQPGNSEIERVLDELAPSEQAQPEKKNEAAESGTNVFDFGTVESKKEPAEAADDMGRMFGGSGLENLGAPEPAADMGSVFDQVPPTKAPPAPAIDAGPFDFGTIPDSASREPAKVRKDEDIPLALRESGGAEEVSGGRRARDFGTLGVSDEESSGEGGDVTFGRRGFGGDELEAPPESTAVRERERPRPSAPDMGGPIRVDKRLAEIYLEHGFIEKAIAVFEKLLEREPSNEEYNARLVELTGSAGPAAHPEDGVFPSEILEAYGETAEPALPPSPDPAAAPVEEPAPGRPRLDQTISLNDLFSDEGKVAELETPKESPHPSLEPKDTEEPKEEKESKEGFESFQSWLDGLRK
jgi:tetratricopeptide (TPR) repeat protein